MWKILLFHDTFLMRGWAERMNIEIAKLLNADIATSIWSPSCYNAESMWFYWNIIETYPEFQKGIIGFLKMKWRFLNSKKLLENYDSIFFSNEAITGVWGILPGKKTYYYAHSISRHLFDQRKQYLQKVPFLLKPLFFLFSIFLKFLYKQEIKKIDTIFTNSQTNKKRISDWLNRDDAIIIYPSVDTQKFNIYDKKSILQVFAIEWISLQNKEYYLSFSRLTHAKRIDTIIRAFQQLPDKKIIILYGENDSQKYEFIKMVKWFPNILFHKLIDNNNLPYMINWALMTICISENEDFGMVAIESMACGTPVIAVNEWWYQESMIDKKTGYLIHTENLENNLIKTIQDTHPEQISVMQDACRKQAEVFSLENMNSEIKKYL